MRRSIVGNISFVFFLFLFCDSVSVKKPPHDPSVPDETDMQLVDEFLQSVSTSTGNSADRESLGSTTPSSKASPNPLITENGDQCKCVSYLLCDMESTAETPANQTQSQGYELEGHVEMYGNLNETGESQPKFVIQCENSFDICCPLQHIKDGGTQKEPTESPTSTTTASPEWEGHKSCGQRNKNGVGSPISTGIPNEAKFGEFPWTVAVIQMEKNEDDVTIHKYVGGGALIHPQVVLTAAHNILGKNRSTLRVRLGEWDTQTNDEPFPSQDREVQKVVMHERFLLKTLYNDVALLVLNDEARFTPNVDTVCLPPMNIKKLSFEDQTCYTAGWGKDKEGQYSTIMKRVQVTVISKDKCQEDFGKSEKLPGFRLDKSFMCASSEGGEDTCKGDGGSALVCALQGKDVTHYVQVGAVSWGLGCASKIYPGAYTDIQYMTPWILKQLDKEGFSKEYCTF